MRKSRDSDGSLDLNGLLLCGMPVATIHSLNRQKVNKFIQENWRISQRAAVAEKLNIGLANVSELFAASGYPTPHTSAATSAII